jgi:hypothetical protein
VRHDLNKLLCERERHGHDRKYKEVRRNKKFISPGEEGENMPSFESTKFRYSRVGEQKSFSENLTPLQGLIRANVGKRWDTFYSELCEVFDMSSVINQHILQHLYQYVEKEIYLKDDELYVRGKYSHSTDTKLRDSSTKFYVDPRDGKIHKNKYEKHQRRAQEQADALEAKDIASIYHKIDNDNVLHKIDGVWFHFTMEDVLPGKYVFTKPQGENLFKLGIYKNKERTWEQLDEHDRARFGIKTYQGNSVYDVYLKKQVINDKRYGYASDHATRYHVTKKTASHQMLKRLGLV